MAAGAHAPALTVARLGLAALLCLATAARADEAAPGGPASPSGRMEGPPPAPPPEERSRLGAWQLHLHVLLGVEPVEGARAVAFGTSAELLWRCRVGVFAGLLSSKGNAVLASVDNGQVLPAPGDRVSVPLGLAFRPLGHLGRRAGAGARGWAARLAAGVGLELGISAEHIRTSGDSATVAALHAALGLDVPLWGGPVEGGVALRLYGRFIAAPSVSIESGQVQMPSAGGQLYAGLAWAL